MGYEYSSDTSRLPSYPSIAASPMLRILRTLRLQNNAYRPVPQYMNTTAKGYRQNNRVCWALTGFIMVVCVGTLWGVNIVFSGAVFSPLINYQNLNPPGLVDKSWKPLTSPADARAVVSTLYSDSFAIGVAVMGHSVRAANVSARLILPYLENRVSAQAICIASAVGWEPIPVAFIPPPHNGKGIHHRFYDQYTKLNIWALDKRGIERAVYLDADTLVRRNFDELFDSPFSFAAVPDVYIDSRGFPVNFNAGVLAFRPSSAVLDVMKEKIATADFPLKQAEQSFLNLFFATNVVRLPYAYNANLSIKKRNPTMWEGLKDEMRIVHYTMTKPFLDDSPGLPKILTEKMQKKAIERSAARHDKEYAEEVGWWAQAFDRMMQERRTELQACYPSS